VKVICRPTSVPRALALAALALALVAPGCKRDKGASPDDSGVEDLTIVVEADKSRILQEEQSLQAKREGFEKERERLTRERQDIESKLASLSKKDKRQRDELEAQQRRLEEEDKRVRDRAKAFETDRQKLEDEKTKLLDRISKMTQTKGGLTIEQREQLIAQREKEISDRERAVAEREQRAAGREAEAGKRLEELTRVLGDLSQSGSLGVTKTVVMSGAGAGAPATKATADKARRQARARMEQKSILVEDLPPATRGLWQNANKAFDDKDYGSATEGFGEVDAVVAGIVVNADFVKAKMGRINRDAAKRTDEASQKQINTLLAEVSDAMTEGRYDRANRKMNQIVTLLGEK
jgi:DNA repair exonuclease SbcCD ATPase subunit